MQTIPEEGSLLTASSLQATPLGSSASQESLNFSNASVNGHWAATGMQPHLLVDLESLICRQHSELQLFIEELLKRHTILLESQIQGYCEQIKQVHLHLETQSEQMKLMRVCKQGDSHIAPEALQGKDLTSKPEPPTISGGVDGCATTTTNRTQRRVALAVESNSIFPCTTCNIDTDSAKESEINPAGQSSHGSISRQTSASKLSLDVPDNAMDLVRKHPQNPNEYGLASITDATVTSSIEHSITHGPLTVDQTNLYFVGDLLRGHHDSFKSRNAVSDLQNAMQNWELPRHPDPAAGGWFGVEPERTSWLAHFLHSTAFEYFVCAMVLGNTYFITYATDYAVEHPYNQTTDVTAAIQTFFGAYYLLEVIVRLQVHRHYFFTNKDKLWNILDFSLSVAAVYDFLTHYVSQTSSDTGGGGFSFTFLRLLRLFRVMKIMRLFRVVRFFTELNVLLKVVASSMRPLFWCSFMFLVIIYMFAVVFVHGTASYVALDTSDPNTKATLLDYFGSVRLAMVSLSKASTGGEDWGPIADLLLWTGEVYYAMFLFFIGFSYMALMNILTGLFVDRTFKAVADDHDGLALERLENDRGIVMDLCRLWCSMTGRGIDADTTIPYEQFQSLMSSPVMRARLAVLDLEVWDSDLFFHMLTSVSDINEIDLQCWVTGCMQLRGVANRVSLHAVHADLQRLKRHIGVTVSRALKRNKTAKTQSSAGTPDTIGTN